MSLSWAVITNPSDGPNKVCTSARKSVRNMTRLFLARGNSGSFQVHLSFCFSNDRGERHGPSMARLLNAEYACSIRVLVSAIPTSYDACYTLSVTYPVSL